MILKVEIRGRLSALLPFASAMKVSEFTANEDEPDSGEIVGEFHDLPENVFSMVEFLTNIAKTEAIIGRYWAFHEKPEHDEFGKFVWSGVRGMEMETDRWGNFTFPDAGCAADFDEFLTREKASMLEFLLFRDQVAAGMFPREALYTDAIVAARTHLGEDFSENTMFVEMLQQRVREIQAQEAANMHAYDALDFITHRLGKDGLALIRALAQNVAETE